METTSIKDYIRYGLPKQGREVGRGHYGTVYESKNWANSHSCVVKSVIPPEDRNLEDLGLEFYYLKSISVLAFWSRWNEISSLFLEEFPNTRESLN